MKTNSLKKYHILAIGCLILIVGIVYYYFFASFTGKSSTSYVYIDTDDNIDSVYAKVQAVGRKHCFHAFKALVRHSSYSEHIRTGRYAIHSGDGTLAVFRRIKNGMQEPVSLTIPSVRTVGDLAAAISSKMMIDEQQLYDSLTDEQFCERYGYDTATVVCAFIPNTYDIYWNASASKLMDRMKKESDKFWNSSRRDKAAAMGLTPVQVMTLASIVDEETANNAEKPMIAGMYYNRYKFRDAEYPQGMPLQADPTIKFAWKRFDLKRIYNKLLYINSPYNTYKNPGLPPGPIRIPSVAGIDAVLNYVHHDYLYMCAKEDFSGTHNFARTYSEHLANAARYSKALNERGIK